MKFDAPVETLLPDLVHPGEENQKAIWSLVEELMPVYRCLCGPGFKQSLEIISKTLPLEITEFPSGSEIASWIIPKEFKINEAYVLDPSGKRILDFATEPYCVWLYSQPFHGVVSRAELLEHISTTEQHPEAIPLRNTYYRDQWGLSAPQSLVDSLPEGDYTVHIDAEHFPGALRIGEYFLPGETNEEILVCSYLCHPRGANDNLSGVAVAVELFKLLAQLPNRHYSYRLALWPETIGAITYIESYPDRIARTIGGYKIAVCGDKAPVGVDQTYYGTSMFDRAAVHAMKFCGMPVVSRPFNVKSGQDTQHFNGIALRIPMATLTRGGPTYEEAYPGLTPPGYPWYHTNFDDLNAIGAEYLFETLRVAWFALLAVERAQYYRGTYHVTPFLSRYGVYPHHHGIGSGGNGDVVGNAYYQLIPSVDGKEDLLTIADKALMPVYAFDEPVREFMRVGLIEPVKPGHNRPAGETGIGD